MQKSQSQAPNSGFGVPDVLFILFKHKWLILIFTLAGLGAAAVVFSKRIPSYVSQAKILIRYVRETGTIDPYEEMKNPGTGRRGKGDPVISTEVEILCSLDLAAEVAEAVGIEKLLPELQDPGPQYLPDAAGVVAGGLEVLPGRSPNVIYISYESNNVELAKPTLETILERYFEKHLKTHRSAAAYDLIDEQTKEVRQRLQDTEDKLNELRSRTGIMSLVDATEALSSQRSKTLDDLMTAKTELAEYMAGLPAVEQEAVNEGEAVADGESAAEEVAKPIPQNVITEYNSVLEILKFLRAKNVELKLKFKSGNRLLGLNQQQIDDNEAKRRNLVGEYPDLAAVEVASQNPLNPEAPLNPLADKIAKEARIKMIKAKIAVLESHLVEIKKQFQLEYDIGAEIEELERQKGIDEGEYLSLESNLKTAKMNGTLDPSRMPNITIVQQPSRPVKTYDELTQKIILGLAGGGLALGVGIAFLMELLFQRRVVRPIEIQTRLQLPLLLSIPFIRRKERGGLLMGQDASLPRLENSDDTALLASEPEELGFGSTPQKLPHFILPYSETIRDRMIFNFEINNVTHKPKMVAVTGLSKGAGSSTIAAGLAKSFSEIPGTKILLVDLSSVHPEENPMFGEIPRVSLNGALHLATTSKFKKSQQSLYFAGTSARRDEGGLTTFSPVHLYQLMPKLQESDYDYIIFDMPAVDQTSRTLTMAGMMDKVLFVLDAENTSRDGLMWGYSELMKGKADVSCIFNKTRSHVPDWLTGKS